MAKKDGSLDLRIKRTQKAIKESFFHLVDKKGFERISVKDITDGAMISRNTFYLHYTDKYDLLNKICADMMRSLFFRVGKQLRRVQRGQLNAESVATVISHGIYAIDTDKNAYRILFNSSSSDILTSMLSSVIGRCLDLFTDSIGGIDKFSREYIVSGMIGLIKYYSANQIDNIDEKCLYFTKIHLGKIIEMSAEKASTEYGNA
ncbi:MAG: TetR/AcrR family transcriptional regulator [Clostridium sp.]|nr:TetR/AcrR family transcriptional regulator [Clostridium sp.]